MPSPRTTGYPPICSRLWPPSPDEIGGQTMPIPLCLLVSLAAPSYLKLCLLDDVLIPPSRRQITAPGRLPHLQPSAPPLSPGPTPVHANLSPKHGASRHTRQSPHPRRELAADIPTAFFYLRVCRHRPLLAFPLRLPHPVASHARVRMMLQSIANSLPTPPPSPLDRLPRHSLNLRTFPGRFGWAATIYARQSCSAPRYCNHEPSDHPI